MSRHLLHGFAVSSQSSQGKTVDRVLVAMDAMSATSAATQATLYVAASRGRESCTLFTDDKDLLAHAFQRSSERRAALEFIQSQNQNSSKTIYEKAPKTHHPNHPRAPSSNSAGCACSEAAST